LYYVQIILYTTDVAATTFVRPTKFLSSWWHVGAILSPVNKSANVNSASLGTHHSRNLTGQVNVLGPGKT